MWEAKSKWYCAACDHVTKRRDYVPVCPTCREPMQAMGRVWRPGKKGTRTRMWDYRQEGPTKARRYWVSEIPVWPPGADNSHRMPAARPPRRIGRKRARAMREAAMKGTGK